eukprot:5181382-Amphidinium_carterae.1
MTAVRLSCVRVGRLSGFSSHSSLSVVLDEGEADLSGWRLKIPLSTPKSSWGKVATDLGVSAADYWNRITEEVQGLSSQDVYEVWLKHLNLWLDTTEENATKETSVKGSADYYFDEGTETRQRPRCDSNVWQLHVLQKAKAWATQIRRHAELENLDSEHCIHLRRKLNWLPFRKVAPELLPPRPLEDDWNTVLTSAITQLNKDTDRKLKDWKISMLGMWELATAMFLIQSD